MSPSIYIYALHDDYREVDPEYLHRSLNDWLSEEDIIQFLQDLENCNSDYNIALQMVEFYLSLIKEGITVGSINKEDIKPNSLLNNCLDSFLKE